MSSVSHETAATHRPPFTTSERLIRTIARQVNVHRPLKRLSHLFLRTVGAGWVHYCTRRLLDVTNASALDALSPDRGIVIASNHRSLFDMYVVSSLLLRRCAWIERLYFPVRSEYVYERLDGLLLNALMSGLSMYPPIYRDRERRSLNRDSMAFIASELRRPGTIVGLHPEGRRGTGADPYALLPAQPGIGDIVWRARPVVLPVFVLGVSNDLLSQVAGNVTGRGAPITITFGQPLDLTALFDTNGGPRTFLRIAQTIRAEIETLGRAERARRNART